MQHDKGGNPCRLFTNFYITGIYNGKYMRTGVDLTGKKFGRYTVIGRDQNRKGGYWLCRCECGNTKSVKSYNLVRGSVKSCGCYSKEFHTENLIGQKYGRLTVVERAERSNEREAEHHAYWKCMCDCGNYHVVRSSDLKSGNVQSCGCLSIDGSTTHGMKHTWLYSTWCNIKSRCYNPNNKSYVDYGLRGIKMCDRWKNDFQAFYDDVSVLPHFGEDGYTINRTNNDGDYEPKNVEWADDETQANNKRNNHFLAYNGKTQTIAQWACELGMNQYTLYNRILTYHWSIERALTTPVKK